MRRWAGVLSNAAWVGAASVAVACSTSPSADRRALMSGGGVAPVAKAAATWVATSGTVTALSVDGASATTLGIEPTGSVLVVGGETPDGSTVLSTAAIFTLGTPSTVATTGHLSTPRWGHASALLHDGRVAVAGGFGDTETEVYLSTVELYNPTSGGWSISALPAMSTPRANPVATTLANGHLLVVGGGTPVLTSSNSYNVSSAEEIDPTAATPTWAAPVTMPHTININGGTTRAGITTTTGGTVVVFGAQDDAMTGNAIAVLLARDSTTGNWRDVTNACVLGMTTTIAPSAVAALNDGSVFVSGQPQSCVVAIEGGTDRTITTADVFGLAVTLADGRVLLTGGGDSTNSSAIFDLSVPKDLTKLPGPNTIGAGDYPALAWLGGERALAIDSTFAPTVFYDDPLGTTCDAETGLTTCQAGAFCSDGVCCNEACNDPCTSCSVPGYVGTCTPVVGKPVRDCGLDSGVVCCDGTHVVCQTDLAMCVADSGVDATADGVVEADGATDATSSDVAPPDVALSDAELDVMAETAEDIGIGTDVGAEVATTSDSAAASDASTSTSITGDFKSCSLATDCSNGLCIDGVCCDTACTDTCHACNLATSPGVCSLVPLGLDPRGVCSAGKSCVETCDGQGACTAATDGTVCAPSKCTGPSSGVGPSECSGNGAACSTSGASSFDCGAYACDPAVGGCRTVCTAASSCASGFVCDSTSERCVKATSGGGGGCGIGRAARSVDGGEAIGLAFAAVVSALRRRRRSPSLRPQDPRRRDRPHDDEQRDR